MQIALKFLLLLGVISCGVVEAPRETSYTVSSTGEPFEYKFLDNSCEDIDQAKLNQTPKIKLFVNGSYQKIQMEKVENSHLVSEILMGGKVESGLLRNGKLKIRDKARAFKYCFDPEELTKDHYEDAAISVLDPINKFENRFMKLVKENSISKVKIRVLPHYIQVKNHRSASNHTMEKQTLINNAMYAAKRQEILFLPQGRTNTGFIPFGGIPLWKQPMVALHEYGHHFFRSILGSSIVKDKGELCIDNRHKFDIHGVNDQKSEIVLVERKVDVDQAIGALNEGFADIFSFYASVDNKNLLKFGCMEKSRDVSSKIFISQNEKRLSRDVLDAFLSPEKIQSATCIEGPNYQNIHIIGAIFAHGFYKLLEQIETSKLIKLELLLEWTKSLKTIHSLNLGIERFLHAAAINFYQILSSKYPEVKTKCTHYFTTFPEADYSCR